MRKTRQIIVKTAKFLFNPRFLLCFGLGWLITNGWSYILLGVGTALKSRWMVAAASAYLAFLWLPISPEKLVTLAIAMFLLKKMFPDDKMTLGVLRKMRQNIRARRKAQQEQKESKAPVTKEAAVSNNNNQENKYQKKILTIPNVLSFFRLCLIPVTIWLYIGKEDYFGALMVLTLSGITDIADGIIARKFKMVSDFGKAFDPIADKLTQIATLCCLVSRFRYMLIPLIMLVVKEVCTGITALISIKRTDTVEGAVWHGKLTTITLYLMMAIHMIWYSIPIAASFIMVGICIGIMIMSFIMYSVRNCKAIKYKTFENHENKKLFTRKDSEKY